MAANSALSAEGFWRFSLTVYARPGAGEALLGMQDRGGHNVNLVLFGLWLGLCAGRRLDAAGLARARAAIVRLDDGIVAPLRRLRRHLRPDPDPDVQALRRRIAALELAAERTVQARLFDSFGPGSKKPRIVASPQRGAAAEANLRLILGADFAAAEVAALRRAIAGFG